MKKPDEKILNIAIPPVSAAEETSPAAGEKKLKAILDAANDAICCIDEKTKQILWANAEFYRMTGYLEKELLVLPLTDLSPGTDIVNIMKEIKTAIQQGNYTTREIPIFTKTKKSINCEVRGTVITMGGRKLWLGYFRDISRRKEVEAALKECIASLEVEKKQLEQKNLALTELAEYLEQSKSKMKEDIGRNVETLITPTIRKMRLRGVSKKYVDLLQKHLSELTATFGRRVSQGTSRLSPREIEISGMIKSGLSSKEIAELLNISYKTVDKHRRDIRKRLGISKKKVNLTSFLQKF